jgi:hypothetical protein
MRMVMKKETTMKKMKAEMSTIIDLNHYRIAKEYKQEPAS